MGYEDFGKLIDENKADEIRESLNGMSEQELGLLLDMLNDDQAEYLESLLAEDLPKEEQDKWAEDSDEDALGERITDTAIADIDTEDVNDDGDVDLQVADTNGNGNPDTAIVTADSEPEKKEAIKSAKEELGFDDKDKTSTGKTKGELEDKNDVVSDEKKKDMPCSDATQKNIMAALLDHRF